MDGPVGKYRMYLQKTYLLLIRFTLENLISNLLFKIFKTVFEIDWLGCTAMTE